VRLASSCAGYFAGLRVKTSFVAASPGLAPSPSHVDELQPLRHHHDLEDVVAIVDGRSELHTELAAAGV
jgi:hypothetical protein